MQQTFDFLCLESVKCRMIGLGDEVSLESGEWLGLLAVGSAEVGESGQGENENIILTLSESTRSRVSNTRIFLVHFDRIVENLRVSISLRHVRSARAVGIAEVECPAKKEYLSVSQHLLEVSELSDRFI